MSAHVGALSRWPGESRPAATQDRRIAAIQPYPLDRHWDALLLCVALYILCAVGRIHQLFDALGVLHPAMLGGGLAIILFALDQSRNRRVTRVRVMPIVCVVGLFVWMILSLPTALVLGNSVDLVAGNFAKTMAMTIVVAASVRGVRDTERLLLAYLMGATIYSAVAIFRFNLGSGQDWRLGNLYYYDANDLAVFLVTAMPMALYFGTSRRGWLTRGVMAASVLLMTVAFVRTGSRGGFLALAAVMVFLALRFSAVSLRKRIGAAVLIVAVVGATATGRYWSQMESIVADSDYNRTEETGRLKIWERGIGYMLSHPVFGVGANNFETAEGTISPLAYRQQIGFGVTWNAAHNSYIQTGAELGIPGVLLFTAVILTTLHRLRSWGRQAPSPRANHVSQALSASLIGFAVGAFFLSLAYHELLYTLVAFAVGLTKYQGSTCVSRT